MKKTMFSVAAIAATLLFAQTAMAGCDSSWTNSGQLYPGSDPVVYYLIPAKAGTHAVKYHDSVNVGGTKVTFSWSNNSGASWNFITENEVTTSEQTQSLYAGSSNIIFKFMYENNSAYDVETFSFKRCIN